MKIQRRRFLHLAAGAILPTVSGIGRAQTYPTRPVRYQFEFGWRLHRQVGKLFAFEDGRGGPRCAVGLGADAVCPGVRRLMGLPARIAMSASHLWTDPDPDFGY
jgi:hypothetical protein